MPQPTDNPFQAPIQPSTPKTPVPANDEVLDFIALAKKWEKYRLIYNGVLVVETVGLAIVAIIFNGVLVLPILAVAAVFGAVVCNFFFLLGPALDGYCQWIFGTRKPIFGQVILAAGVTFTMLLAAATVLGV